jgi:DNA-binding CsgD family transcriptional regulator/tetratricopeptide (TPR) repeat protein
MTDRAAGGPAADGREPARRRARAALLHAADTLFEASDYANAARTLRIALDRWDGDPADRLAVVDRLARCAEMSAEHVEAGALLRELADGYQRRGDLTAFAGASRRLATLHELAGDWTAALAAREAAAAAFADSGQPGEAAADRLAVAAHLRGAARFAPALATLGLVLSDARASARQDLVLRAEALRGNVLARLGRHAEGVPAVRAALDEALRAELPDVAAEIQQRLADSLEHSGDYDGAVAAYRAAYLYCDTHGADATGHLCRACATAVLFSRGEWDLAIAVCADVLEEPDTAWHPRAASACVCGLIYALRGQAGKARPLLTAASGLSGRIELTAVELLSGWGLTVLDAQAGAVASGTDRLRVALDRVRSTQERHYCVPLLQWAATFFAVHGLASDVLDCTAVLSAICDATGQQEAVATLAHAFGETQLPDDPAGAAGELRRAAGMFCDLGLPFPAAQAQYRAAAAARALGDDGGARDLLLAARETAARLTAEPLLADCETMLGGLGAGPTTRGGKARGASAPSPRTLAGLTARELDVMLLVAAGNTSREAGAALFISPRTVEMHVQGCLLKLGCRTRAEAVRKLAELGVLAGQDPVRLRGRVILNRTGA